MTEALRHDAKAAVNFLRMFHPGRLWVLTSILDRNTPSLTRTFGPDTAAECERWIAEQNTAERNVYFTVNTTSGVVNKKPGREGIRSVIYLHVDVDPRVGEELAGEQERIRALLTSRLPATVPPPNVIIFSGGGLQGFWRLSEPLETKGDLEKAEDAKLYNITLERAFGGDQCHNIDRIMRLPGTINWPNAEKQKKGRLPALAALIHFDDGAHDIGQFTKAEAGKPKGGGEKVHVETSQRLKNVHDLDQWGVSERLKTLIVVGKVPDEAKEDDSRSSWLFDAVCHLLRAGVPDGVIKAVITDSEFGISESVLDKGSRVDWYANRQIERAKDEVDEPKLRELNDQFFVMANDGGKCVVMFEEEDPVLERPFMTRQTFENFRNRFMHLKMQIGVDAKNSNPIYAPLGKWWLGHQGRRQYERIVFAPGQDVPGAYNLWQGFGVQPKEGGAHESFLQHVRDNVCRGNASLSAYLLGWMARAVQRPGEQGHVAIVLRGGKGVGKSFFAKHFGKLFGRHYLQVSNSSHLVGNFNSHLRDAVVLFADEAFYAGDKKHDGILKTLVTEDMLAIEGKGRDVVGAPNFIHLIMASNSDHVAPASGDERRYFVLDVGEERKQDTAYFKAIATELESGGYENLLHFLVHYDISNFEVRNVPDTEALSEQKALSASPWMQTILEMAATGVSPDHDRWKLSKEPDWVSASGVFEATSGLPKVDRHRVEIMIGNVLKTVTTDEKPRQVDVDCVVEEGRHPVPLKPGWKSDEKPMRRVKRRMRRLLPLGDVRAKLERYGLEWDADVKGWTMRGDQ